MTAKLTDIDRDFIVYDLKTGATQMELARRYDVSQKTIQRVAKANGISPARHPSVPLSEETLARAKQMLEERTGYAETARTLNIDESNLARRFPGMGLTRAEALEVATAARVYGDKGLNRRPKVDHSRPRG